MYMECINQMALKALCEQDFLTAQSLFRKNKRENPNYLTYHNLGVFYYFNGMEWANGKVRSAEKQAIRLLYKAQNYHVAASLNYAILGTIYFRQKKYEAAFTAFRSSVKLEENWIRQYNLGITLYYLEKYDEAANCLKRTYELCTDLEEKKEIYSIYAITVSLYDNPLAKKLLYDIIKSDQTFPMPVMVNIFLLAYQCGDYRLAIEWFEKTLPEWVVDTDELAIAFDCYSKVGNEKRAQEILNARIDELCETSYVRVKKNKIQAIRNAYENIDYREKMMLKYKFDFPIKYEEYFEHNVLS